MRLAGASYLVLLAMRCLLRAYRGAQAPDTAPAVGESTAFGQGFVTSVTNVKVLLFYLAFLPQFVTPGVSGTAIGLLLLGLSFGVTGSLWNTGVALPAGAAAPALARSRRARSLLDGLAALLLLVIAIPIFRQL